MATTLTFFNDGIPPLGDRSGSKSKGSVSKEQHEDAVMFERPFNVLADEQLCLQDTSFLWIGYQINGESNDWGAESDIQGLVKQVLQTAIYTVGLQGKLKCFNELSIFDLRPDIWIVCASGDPIGVVEVKKPGDDDILQNEFVQGQLFDYMLRLQSFFGLEHVFGILSTYDEWRICWMPQSDAAAAATTAKPPAQEKEQEMHTVVPARVLHGSRLFKWNDKDLPRLLCTTILKMYSSPTSSVQLVDKNRPYIIIDENQWYWGRISVRNEDSLHHSELPSANKFTLLADLREGADGRVWRGCTDAGLGCCIKFPLRSGKEEGAMAEQKAQIQDEAEKWHRAYGKKSARVVQLGGRPALIMRYLRPLELVEGKLSKEDEEAVKTAIEKFADNGLKHDDMALRHLGVVSPPKAQKLGRKTEPTEVMLFDLGRVSEADDSAVAVADMLAQLNLT